MKRNFKKICLLAVGFFLLTTTARATEGVIIKKNGDYIEKSSQAFMVHAGGTVYLNTSFGAVVVKSWDKEEVFLSVKKTTDASSESNAKEIFGRFTVSSQKKENDIHIRVQDRVGAELFDVIFQLNVPGKFNLDLETDDGKIEIRDLEGNVKAKTKKGAIRVGDVTGKLETVTAGGAISAGKIGEATKAVTGGGSIRIKSGGTDTYVKTKGGAITVGPANGDVYAKTGGGSITIGPTKGNVLADTNGGSITVDAVEGKVKARTSGGKIEIGSSGGPVMASSGGGSIKINNARASVEANTNGGSIEAVLAVSDKSNDTHCTLKTKGGDVTVYLPEDLPATFRAELSVDKKQRRRKRYEIISDFSLDKKESGRLGGIKHTASGKINGGGDLIKLSTNNSFIYIKKIIK
ncbi:MAG: hypothetical protein JRF25_07070 [Deltaproteobacteria bacterium]|nr:hypothetical protein [Deltaproteobacteria bacterium]